MVERALKTRRHRPIFMVDIAVPRDIEPEVGELRDIYLYTVDDLEEVIQENLKSRQEAAEQAREIIDFQVGEFREWLGSLDAVDLIADYRASAEAARDEVLEKARRMLEAGKDPQDVIGFLANTLTNKLLHTPSAQLRNAGSSGQHELLEAANTLFQLGHKLNHD
jgi:glutamyl-tRNA reductase